MTTNSTSRVSRPPQVWEGFLDEAAIIMLLIKFAPQGQLVQGIVNCLVMALVSVLRLFLRGASPIHTSMCLAALSHLKVTPRYPRLWWTLTLVVYVLDTIFTETAMALCQGEVCKQIMIGGTLLYLFAAAVVLHIVKKQLPNSCERAVNNLAIQFTIIATWIITKKAVGGSSVVTGIFYLGYLMGSTAPIKAFKTRHSFKPGGDPPSIHPLTPVVGVQVN